MKNTVKTITDIFYDEIMEDNAASMFGCKQNLINTMRYNIKTYNEYPNMKTMTKYLEKAGYEITTDVRIVKNNKL